MFSGKALSTMGGKQTLQERITFCLSRVQVAHLLQFDNPHNLKLKMKRLTSCCSEPRVPSRQRLDESSVVEACALELSKTPILKALPVVFTSGFLYQHECIVAASTCTKWYLSWKEAEEEVPDYAKVEVRVLDISRPHDRIPHFVHYEGVLAALKSPEFARRILDAVHELRVSSELRRAAQDKCCKKQPEWGTDIRYVKVLYWGRTSYTGGGICISYSKHDPAGGREVARIRLDSKFRLWKVQGLRESTWAPLYDWKPIWSEQVRGCSIAA